MHKSLKLFFLFIVLSITVYSQNTRLHDLRYFDYENEFSFDHGFHSSVKPFSYDDQIAADSALFEKYSVKFGRRLFNENLASFGKEDLKIILNPIIYSSALFDSEHKRVFSDNRIGFGLNSSFKQRLFLNVDYFFSRTGFFGTTNIWQDSIDIIPHFDKKLSQTGDAYIFQSFSGEIAFKATENIYFHLGKGKHFFGNGYRSLFLSDNSNSYPYFKVTADIWRIKYVWMAMKLKDISLVEDDFDPVLYDKAVFTHYFSLNLTKRINFDFFESVITNPYDQLGNRSGYEWSYFNPVVFYRPVEFYNGTSDNSLMGAALNLRLFNSLYLYSQFILDDLIISRLSDGSGWWGNKFGMQAGIKAYNFLNVEGLFVRGELNLVRPYTYSHGQSGENNDIANLNYGSYVQAMAHPLGANFGEAVAQIKYKRGRLITEAQLNIAQKGIDPDSVSYGGNIYLSYNLRPDDYNISFLQGAKANFIYAKAEISYILNPAWDLSLNASVQYRKLTGWNDQSNLLFNIGIRTNIFNERDDYF